MRGSRANRQTDSLSVLAYVGNGLLVLEAHRKVPVVGDAENGRQRHRWWPVHGFILDWPDLNRQFAPWSGGDAEVNSLFLLESFLMPRKHLKNYMAHQRADFRTLVYSKQYTVRCRFPPSDSRALSSSYAGSDCNPWTPFLASIALIPLRSAWRGRFSHLYANAPLRIACTYVRQDYHSRIVAVETFH